MLIVLILREALAVIVGLDSFVYVRLLIIIITCIPDIFKLLILADSIRPTIAEPRMQGSCMIIL